MKLEHCHTFDHATGNEATGPVRTGMFRSEYHFEKTYELRFYVSGETFSGNIKEKVFAIDGDGRGEEITSTVKRRGHVILWDGTFFEELARGQE